MTAFDPIVVQVEVDGESLEPGRAGVRVFEFGSTRGFDPPFCRYVARVPWSHAVPFVRQWYDQTVAELEEDHEIVGRLDEDPVSEELLKRGWPRFEESLITAQEIVQKTILFFGGTELMSALLDSRNQALDYVICTLEDVRLGEPFLELRGTAARATATAERATAPEVA